MKIFSLFIITSALFCNKPPISQEPILIQIEAHGTQVIKSHIILVQ